MSSLIHSSVHNKMLLFFSIVLSLVLILCSLPTTHAVAGDNSPQSVSLAAANELSQFQHAARYGALPLNFELNQGQTNQRVKFLARSAGYLLFLTRTEAVMVLQNASAHQRGKENRDVSGMTDTQSWSKAPRSVVRMRLEGANPAPRIEGLEQLTTTTNYFAGPDPAQWRTNIPTYGRVRYEQVYPGIDMVYYGDQRQLEYDFVVAPGANPDVIQIAFRGIQQFEIDGLGDLILHTAQGDIRQSKPIAYQETNGVREEVSVDYVPNGVNRVGFQLGEYDATRPLTIDPVLIYSTYLGGSGFDQGYAIAVDSLGSAYVTGRTAAIDFPTTAGAFQTNYGGGDAFVAKLNPTGTALVYSTYLNGASGNGITVDAAGNAFVTGEALTLNFPTTSNAFQTAPMGFDTFVTKLNSAGSALVYSARFGGNFDDFGRGIALDSAGNAYITGWTVCQATICTFPTVNAFQPNYAGGYNDAFVTKIDSSGSTLVYSTYLGGGTVINATEDWGEAIAVDKSGSAYVTGYTYSPDFPVTAGAFDTSRAGLDAFITKFTPDGTSLVYSTFLGGAGREQGNGIAVDANGNAYITGVTESFDSPFTVAYEGFPVTSGAFQSRGTFDAFVTRLNAQGSALVYSTYLGGSGGSDRGWAIAVDDTGNAYITGDTNSTDFPIVNSFQTAYGGGLSDAFVAKLNAAGSALVYSTFLGGSLTDEGRGIALNGSDVFATGDTSSNNFPTLSAAQLNNGGGLNNHDDAFVTKISDVGSIPAPSPTPAASPTPAPAPSVDTIVIQRAEYQRSKKLLRVEAKSSEPTAVLRVYVTATDYFIGTLANNGGGKFSGTFSLQTNPKNITVRSTFGGSQSIAVTTK